MGRLRESARTARLAVSPKVWPILALDLVIRIQTRISGLRSTITAEQAHAIIDDLIAEAASRLPADITVIRRATRSDPCYESLSRRATGHVVIEHEVELVGVTAPTLPMPFEVLSAHWSSRGFDVVRDFRDRSDPSLVMEQRGSGFRVTLKGYDRGDVYLSVRSPRIRPNGNRRNSG
ncbi:hypothetical protein [Embleya sp. NBC_00896]|uniref:hypothetical protein n=1 Tax=Embleya sp. NBC_00896 TaxID=2975961 RepID=UPI002F90DE9E|nr:hypothetical protein OG928_38765 [Embleya sp. NBC_00896]